MGGLSAEQIVAGVVLNERLAVGMYGALHRAQHAGQRNLRALLVDHKMLAEDAFRLALTDDRVVAATVALDHPAIVGTIAVEAEGPDVVVVTRGIGRYVTVQDLLADARARGQGGKLAMPVAAAIGRAVVEALAQAHARGVVHGAVHPRSVLVDEEGLVRLADFVVGRALTTAVAQGADSVLWRGLAGYLAPELVVGEEPTAAADVFAAGALLFTMLTGEVPPGSLHVSPAVERLVQRALDTDTLRRYRNAGDLLENMLEAFEDDRWTLAERGELIKAAGLGRSDANLDEATEDLLASLGNAVQPVTRPSMDIRAEAVAARQDKLAKPDTQGRLDALLADLDEPQELTQVEDVAALARDPISELISLDPRQRAVLEQLGRAAAVAPAPARATSTAATKIGSASGRVAAIPAIPAPAVHDAHDAHWPDEPTPLPPPARDEDSHIGGLPTPGNGATAATSASRGSVRARRPSADAAAALDALAGLTGLDDEPRPAAALPPPRLDRAPDRGRGTAAASQPMAAAPAPALRGPTGKVPGVKADEAAALDALADLGLDEPVAPPPTVGKASGRVAAIPAAAAVVAAPVSTAPVARTAPPSRGPIEPILDLAYEPPQLKRRGVGVIWVALILGAGAGGYYLYNRQTEKQAEYDRQKAAAIAAAEDETKRRTDDLPDPGAIRVTSTPPEAGVWLKLGRTPLDSLPLSSSMMHEIRIELPGYQALDTQVLAANWSGTGDTRKANVTVALKPLGRDAKGRSTEVHLPPMPPKPPEATGFAQGRGPIHITSTPSNAEVWMFVGMTNQVEVSGIQAGVAYELRLLKDGFLPGFVSISADDWRDGGDPKVPINTARKKATLERAFELLADPTADAGVARPRGR